MPKVNLQAVSAFKPKRARDYRIPAVERIRAERYGSLSLPVEFTLDVGLVVDHNQTIRQCSRHATTFAYSVERMRWENLQPISWTSTLDCEAIALSYWHPSYSHKELMRVLLEGAVLSPGATLTIPEGSLYLDSLTDFGLTFPAEDYVIHEVPDPIDWQEELVKAMNKKPRRRKKS